MDFVAKSRFVSLYEYFANRIRITSVTDVKKIRLTLHLTLLYIINKSCCNACIKDQINDIIIIIIIRVYWWIFRSIKIK